MKFEISGIEKRKFEREQEKLAKQISVKDSINFDNVQTIAACKTSSFKNKVIKIQKPKVK